MPEEKAQAAKTTKKDFKKVPLDKRTTVKDLDDTNRQLNITETDGTMVEVNLVAPKLRDAEAIDDARTETVPFNDNSVAIRATSPRFHGALFSMFSAPLVDNKPAGKIDWDFFDKHEYGTFKWMMEQADTFLASKFNAPK